MSTLWQNRRIWRLGMRTGSLVTCNPGTDCYTAILSNIFRIANICVCPFLSIRWICWWGYRKLRTTPVPRAVTATAPVTTTTCWTPHWSLPSKPRPIRRGSLLIGLKSKGPTWLVLVRRPTPPVECPVYSEWKGAGGTHDTGGKCVCLLNY